jgi:hypothetical protein
MVRSGRRFQEDHRHDSEGDFVVQVARGPKGLYALRRRRGRRRWRSSGASAALSDQQHRNRDALVAQRQHEAETLVTLKTDQAQVQACCQLHLPRGCGGPENSRPNSAPASSSVMLTPQIAAACTVRLFARPSKGYLC